MSKTLNKQHQQQRLGILWFRNDLRVHDNLLLNYAIDLIDKKKLDLILPIYCYDKDMFLGKSRQAKVPRCGPIRRNFIIECVECVKANMQKYLNSNLFSLYGIPELEIIKLVEKLIELDDSIKIDMVITSKEINSEEIDQENRLKNMLNERKISLKLIW